MGDYTRVVVQLLSVYVKHENVKIFYNKDLLQQAKKICSKGTKH